jgi:DNA-binding GntR family transcriptional regulator
MPVRRASASEQIADELRAQIEGGEFKPGQPLPSDAELAARFDVSKPTITKARAMLVALGLVASRAGAASIVLEAVGEPGSAGHRPRRARRTGRIYPEGHYTRIVRAGLAPASADVAAALGTEPGAPVIERRRSTHAADNTPLSTSTTYFPAILADQCPALRRTEPIRQGTTRYVEQQTGRAAASAAVTVTCKQGGPRPAGDARRPPGTAMLAMSTTTYDAAGAPIAHDVEFHPPNTPVTIDVMPA